MSRFTLLSLAIVLTSTMACSGSSGGAGGGGSGGKGAAATAVKNANPGNGTIGVIGDSLAAGTGATDANLTPAGCLRGLGDPVVDEADMGLTSAEVLTNVDSIVRQKPKMVFISAGGNDAMIDMQSPGRYPEAKSTQALDALFDRLLTAKIMVVYLGLNPPIASDRMKRMSELAQSKGVLVVDGMNGLWSDPSAMSDSVHPNDRGYKIMCDRIKAAIKGYYP